MSSLNTHVSLFIDTGQTIQVVSFHLAQELYALDILCVQEIIKVTSVTAVPMTPDWIEGVINLRGQIIPLINLRLRIGLPPKPYDKHTRFIIIRNREQSTGFVVDAVAEVLRIHKQSLEMAPATTIDKEYIREVSKLENHLVIVLDVDKILHEPQTEQPEIQEEL